MICKQFHFVRQNYVSKLNFFNWNFNFKQKTASCYIWHEAPVCRGANEVSSCVLDNLIKLSEKTERSKCLNVIFYTDNCTEQNNNNNNQLSLTLQYAVSVLESNATNNTYIPISVPNQYVTIIRQTKKTGNPFSVHEMCHKDFHHLWDLTEKIGFKIIKTWKV